MKLYVFRAVPLPIIRSLFTVHCIDATIFCLAYASPSTFTASLLLLLLLLLLLYNFIILKAVLVHIILKSPYSLHFCLYYIILHNYTLMYDKISSLQFYCNVL